MPHNYDKIRRIMAMQYIEGEDGLGPFLKDPNTAKADLAEIIITAAKTWREVYGDIALPGQRPQPEETQALRIDLRQQTYDLLTLIREPSTKEREALEKKGFVFLPVEAKSYAQVVAEDPDYFWPNELQYANQRAGLRDFTPPVMEIALNPTQLALPGSFNKSRERQLAMIEKYSKGQIELEFQDARAIMLPVTAYAQADRVYKQRTDEVLFRTYFARGLDNISEVNAAFAGRLDPDDQFHVYDWYAAHGHDYVGPVPAVVFLKK